ncbi:MAG: c-type cytochrome [Planctomycetes bacterium]|nr:c-type cytochrome [Planctomycetota bacterium]
MRNAGLASTLLLLAACAESPPPDPSRVVAGSAAQGELYARQHCVICHQIGDRGGKLGPVIGEAVKKAVERSATFETIVAELERVRPEHREEKRAKIDPILAELDPERRLRLWLATYLDDPRFENPANRMAVLPMSPEERANVLAWLLSLR